MLLSLGANDELNNKMKEYDLSKFDCIIFDESMLNSPKI